MVAGISTRQRYKRNEKIGGAYCFEIFSWLWAERIHKFGAKLGADDVQCWRAFIVNSLKNHARILDGHHTTRYSV